MGKKAIDKAEPGYRAVLAEVVRVVHDARLDAVRSVNSAMTASYWEIGRRIVVHEQRSRQRLSDRQCGACEHPVSTCFDGRVHVS